MPSKTRRFVCLAFVLAAGCPRLTAPGRSGAADPGLAALPGLMAPTPGGEGFFLGPAVDRTGRHYSGDWAESQVIEVIRPEMAAIRVRFIAVSCDCLRAEMAKRDYAAGERAFLEVRNVKKTPDGGATYAIFLELETPKRLVLEYDLFMQSAPFPAP